jgi:hypothetical protein
MVISPVAVKAKTRRVRDLPCLQHPIVLQGVMANVGEKRSHTDGHGYESHLIKSFVVDAMCQEFSP